MYAEPRYHSSQPRSVSFAAAFAINGAVIAGLFFLIAPTVGIKPITTVLEGRNVPIDPVPPPIDEPKPRPETKASTEQPIVTPIPNLRTESEADLTTTTQIPADPPAPGPAEEVGPTVVADPPLPPLPPLIAAAQDPRYLKDFQPDYPASELRAQRDGTVSVRVLIGTDGRVKDVQQVRATSSAFFEATRRQALGRWRFKPATRGGVPQETWKTMSVRFEIKDQ